MQESLPKTSIQNKIEPKTPWIVQFKLKRKINYGKAVYICGLNQQLGCWNTLSARRLHWTQNDVWTITIEFYSYQPIVFKFITTDWCLSQNSNIQWENGNANRIINSSPQPQNLYQTEWNQQKIVLLLHCIHEEDDEEFDRYYVSGSSKELGNWKAMQALSPISIKLSDILFKIFKTDPSYLYEVNLSHFDYYSFSVSRDEQQISYTYTRKGSTYQSQMHLGRTISLTQQSLKNGRIHQFDYQGTRYIIDEPSFSKLVLQRLTNQLYIALNIRNNLHFQKILQKKITIVFNISYNDEDCSINYYQITTLCKAYNIQLSTCKVDRKTSSHFLKQTKNIISDLENLLINGHRVCIYCSRNLVNSPPIKLLYMTVMGGYSFEEALQAIKKEISISEMHSKVAEDMFFIVSSKMSRGKMQIKTN